MPEGHSVQRIANELNKLFKGKPVQVDSPQGRFASEANLISGQKIKRVRAIGKQLFIDFDNQLTCRVHLGIYGKWRFVSKEKEESLTGAVRVRFFDNENIADLRGPTVCEVIDTKSVKLIEKRLGPDPTNPDPKKLEQDKFIDRVQSSKSAIGLLLMNQDVISGIGNVYRAEILFRAGISPHVPGNQLSKEQLVSLWEDSVKLMKVGVKTGFMITREELLTKRPKKVDRNYVYKREGLGCLRCSGTVVIELMATRKLYWCPGCQR
jgi:endonuclease-8